MSGCGGECEQEQPDCGPCGGGKKRGHKIKILAGSYFSMRIKVLKKTKGTKFDLTGYGVRGWLRRVKHDYGADPEAEFHVTVVDLAAGRVDLWLGAEDTKPMSDFGYYDVEVYKLDDVQVVYRVLQGEYVVDTEVTAL